jgi:hypothetical protein
MALFLIASTLFALLTLVFLLAYFFTGRKNNTLRYLAGGFSILTSLLWLIRTLMR